MAWTGNTLITSVKQNLNELTTAFITSANILEWLNEGVNLAVDMLVAINDFRKLTGIQQNTTQAAAASLTLDADHKQAVKLLVDQKDTHVYYSRPRVTSPGSQLAMFDRCGVIWEGKLTIYPAGTYAISYDWIKNPTEITESDTALSELDDSIFDAAMNYAVFKAASKDSRLRTQYYELFQANVGIPAGEKQ